MKFRQAKKIIKRDMLKQGKSLAWNSDRMQSAVRVCHRQIAKLRPAK